MASPLYNIIGKRQSESSGMLAQFNQFKNSFKGDPKAKVQELLNTGKMTQQQYNQLSSMAQRFMQMMK